MLNFFLEKILNEKVFPREESFNKKVLIVGGFQTMYGDLKNTCAKFTEGYFLKNGAKKVVTFAHFYEGYASSADYLGNIENLSECIRDDLFDIVVVLEGLEKSKNPLQAIKEVRQICKEYGNIYLIVRTPEEKGTYIRLDYYEDLWRYEENDIRQLFAGDNIMGLGYMTPSYLLMAAIQKTSDMKVPSEKVPLYNLRAGCRLTLVESLKLGYFRNCIDLSEIGSHENTDKHQYDHNYLDKYEFFLRKFKNDSFNLLELGIFHGGSARMWEKYFPSAEIYCVDIMSYCKQYEEGRIHVSIMDLSKEDNLSKLHQVHPRVIIDDASHIWSHQIKALFNLFDVLPSGGIYILEDLETSVNMELFPGYNDCEISAYEVCSRIAKIVTSKDTSYQGIFAEKIIQIGMETELISFIKGSCIFIKR